MFGDDIDDTLIGVYEVLQAVFRVLVSSSIPNYKDRRILARVSGTKSERMRGSSASYMIDNRGVTEWRKVRRGTCRSLMFWYIPQAQQNLPSLDLVLIKPMNRGIMAEIMSL